MDDLHLHPLPSRLYRSDGTPTDDPAEAAVVVYVDEDGSHEHPWPKHDGNPAVRDHSEGE